MTVAHSRSDTLTGIRTPLCWTQLPKDNQLPRDLVCADPGAPAHRLVPSDWSPAREDRSGDLGHAQGMTRLPGVVRSTLDWLFRDRATGRFVVGQWPNAALLVFMSARGLQWLIGTTKGNAALALQWLGTAALTWWAGDELMRGVNPFRRILGSAVLVAVGYDIFRQLR